MIRRPPELGDILSGVDLGSLCCAAEALLEFGRIPVDDPSYESLIKCNLIDEFGYPADMAPLLQAVNAEIDRRFAAIDGKIVEVKIV